MKEISTQPTRDVFVRTACRVRVVCLEWAYSSWRFSFLVSDRGGCRRREELVLLMKPSVLRESYGTSGCA